MSFWKQPVTTECLTWPALDRLVFVEILLKARNEDSKIDPFWHGNKYYTEVYLKRGQTIFAVDRYSKEIGINAKKIKKSINRLINRKIIQEINRKSFGLVISLKNYDELVQLSDQSGNQSGNYLPIKIRASNKSGIKNDKELAGSDTKKPLIKKENLSSSPEQPEEESFKASIWAKEEFDRRVEAGKLDPSKIKNISAYLKTIAKDYKLDSEYQTDEELFGGWGKEEGGAE